MTNTKQENTLENSAKDIYVNKNNSFFKTLSNFLFKGSSYSDAKKDLLNYSKSNSNYYGSSFYRTFI